MDNEMELLRAQVTQLQKDLAEAQAVLIEKNVALSNIARMAEALKRPCGSDRESVQAIRNGEYMNISWAARAAIHSSPSFSATLLWQNAALLRVVRQGVLNAGKSYRSYLDGLILVKEQEARNAEY